MLRCFVEAYIDNTVVKSSRFEQHQEYLKAVFTRLNEYKVRINPTNVSLRCVGVFLGHMISEKELEAQPNQIKAIMNMPKPNILKEVKILTGRIAALTIFIARMSN